MYPNQDMTSRFGRSGPQDGMPDMRAADFPRDKQSSFCLERSGSVGDIICESELQVLGFLVKSCDPRGGLAGGERAAESLPRHIPAP